MAQRAWQTVARASRWVAPHGLIQRREARRDELRFQRVAEERRQRLAAFEAQSSSITYDYEAAIAMLVDRGLDEHHIREGSISERSLEWIAARLPEVCGQSPLMVHIGNFVGVSLTYLTHALRELNSEAVVISIDPGMPHRDIARPDQYVHALLGAFGLSSNSIVISGYSGRANARNDGFVVIGDVTLQMTAGQVDAACEDVLPNLARLLPSRADVVILDGNHDAEYLKSELEYVSRLLRPGGLVGLDDVSGAWHDIVGVFETLTWSGSFERPETDGRVGIARRSAASADVVTADG